MALNERELLRLKKLLKEVNDLREQFGEEKIKVAFDKADVSTFNQLTQMAKTYKDVLSDAADKAGDLRDTIKAQLDEMGKIASAQKEYEKGFPVTITFS